MKVTPVLHVTTQEYKPLNTGVNKVTQVIIWLILVAKKVFAPIQFGTLKHKSKANLSGKHAFMRFIQDYICSLVKTFENSLKN